MCSVWWSFFGVVPFLSYWPQSSPKLPKNHFKGNFQNFATKGFMRTLTRVFLPSFTELGKAEVTKRVTKKVDILPLSLRLLKRSRQKILQDHSFPIPHPSAKFCPNPSSFRGNIADNLWKPGSRSLRIIFPATVGMPYILALGYAQIPSLHSRREEANKRFFRSMSHPVSCICSLLPPPRNGTITSRLRSAAIYPRPVTRTKRFTSSVYCIL